MMKKDLSFRIATTRDAGMLAGIGTQTFQAAFGPDNTPEDMQAYLAANFNPEVIQSLIEDTSCRYILGYEGTKVVGYAMLMEGTPPDCVSGPRPIELQRFYVIEEVIGLGYGSELMRACLDEIRRMERLTVWLGVWAENQRAIKFYEKWGFTKVGEKRFVLGSDVQNDFIMERSV